MALLQLTRLIIGSILCWIILCAIAPCNCLQLGRLLPPSIKRSSFSLAASPNDDDGDDRSTSLSRRDSLLIGGGGILYGKLIGDVMTRATRTHRPVEHERRVSATFRRALLESSATATNNNRPLRILEVGIGGACTTILNGLYDDALRECAGSDVAWYGVDASDVPSSETVDQARAYVAQRHPNVALTVVPGDVMNDLPFEDGFFDVVTCCLLLCSVADPARAVREIRRLVRPHGGTFGYVEHVAVEDGDDGHALLRWQQTLLDPLQRAVAHDCHLHRDTESTIREVFGSVDGTIMERECFFVDDMWPVSCQTRGVVVVR